MSAQTVSQATLPAPAIAWRNQSPFLDGILHVRECISCPNVGWIDAAWIVTGMAGELAFLKKASIR